jgi:Mg-chelatase subunit ChlD
VKHTFFRSIAILVPALALACAKAGDPGAGTGGGAAGATNGTAGATGAAGAGGAGSAGSGLQGGSSYGGAAGATNTGAGGVSAESNCGLQTFNLVRKPADVLLVLDRSASMQDPPSGATATTSKWDLVVPAVDQVITDTNTALAWGMKSFPEGEGSECAAGSVTPMIDVPVAPMNAPAVTAAVMKTTPMGNGTPTSDAIMAAVAYLKGLPTDRAHYILLATDGEPSCPKPSDTARMDAVTAVSAAAAAGFHTFVVGVATTKASATTVLNQLAVAGLEPRPDLNPAATRYFLANTQDELVSSLKVITGLIPSCAFTLSSSPPDPENIAVKVSGVKAPRDPSHMDGWDYTQADHSAVAVYGSWCDKIQGAADMVQIIFGCPDIIIP